VRFLGLRLNGGGSLRRRRCQPHRSLAPGPRRAHRLEVRFFTSITHRGKSFKAFSRLFNQLFELSAREFEVADLLRDFGFQYCTQPGSEQLFIF